MSDEETDVSTHEQVSVCVRFVECTGGKVTLCENVFCEGKQNNRWKSCWVVLTSLHNFGIVIDNMRAEECGEAADMSGIHWGIQARIRERIPNSTIRTL